MNRPGAVPFRAEAVGRRGTLSYEFEREGPRTILARSSCSSPWHHVPPCYLDESGCAYIWLVNPSGGLVGGDHVSVEARLGRECHVLMTSPSANRVYRSPAESAVQDVRVSVGPGARLEWLPELTIPFAGARFRQTIHVDVAPGATVVLWDAMAAGRIARGERWAFACFENEIRIRTASGASVVERFRLSSDSVGLVARGWDYVASLFIVGDAIATELLNGLKDGVSELLDRWPDEVLGGASETAVPGLAIKIVARSAPGLSDLLEAISATIRRHLWALPAYVLRRY